MIVNFETSKGKFAFVLPTKDNFQKDSKWWIEQKNEYSKEDYDKIERTYWILFGYGKYLSSYKEHQKGFNDTNHSFFKFGGAYKEAVEYFDSEIKFLGVVKDLAEEDWRKVVDWGTYVLTFKNYITNDNHKSNQLQTATESGKSLMESLNLPMGNWLLIKYENR